MPNGLQGTAEGLYLIDQIHDNVLLVDETGKVLKDLPTECSNSSGITVGGGYIWAGLNGPTKTRAPRPTDRDGFFVLKLDPNTGKTLDAFPIPDKGSVHGLEWRDGSLWVSNPSGKMLYEIDSRNYEVRRRINLPLPRVHGIAWEDGNLWAVFTSDRVILKFDVKTGGVIDKIEISKTEPEPHGLTMWKGDLWYCDAQTAWICRIKR
jgi:hypothetical protein